MTADKELTDEEIIEKVRTSNQDLYAVVIDRYQKKLIRYAYNLIKNEERAADIVQESFIKAFINLNSFNIKKKFSSWIYRIVHNQAINLAKKYQKETPLLENWDFKSNDDIEKDFEEKETKEKVEKCLKEIPLLYSEPLSLHYIDEKSYEEISDILRIPMGTVATRINRAKKLMKNICQKI
ncbi:MAG: RNA polymerase, sigma-24 subunit, ECF subfamily [Candidatus Nomurabacteria bacterium GW2011_GWA2_43_66]|uniref:RNA polymerase, sigma-24 subunit, ECF subfamily n=1 Tax=Candidatus Nomurabacteria bacterium GW2011_GWF2_43_24 TaxID=1618778 RepID=A0A0G1HHF3_9BACT|nr:MAG: RNA polymerase, sigma-24 subunit, ECF subfamily [Parcubacteria group bacterium GW2011_GWC1_42_21]KKS57207.1 MAG: RNA polymerase, sigma-24 subunit, ECF subfamily [Candidatus Nomurabacteria bacterium GW2011_GWF1_42_40]KKS99236.1 MAG: RNA polymerase, sigma-24 subunit, ECF subfamily [Candidatus Nomurabacteria bacterium GW2011_GWA1_43_17]KKT10279.1 MAG: RNA polymerase, sigma-24 subunit, ECF subfamily [Candidatus Nomurabacteria bacterium GW2011_GWF2_43_24]KKT17529.1 MAG: RNA polymerase, sigma